MNLSHSVGGLRPTLFHHEAEPNESYSFYQTSHKVGAYSVEHKMIDVMSTICITLSERRRHILTESRHILRFFVKYRSKIDFIVYVC